VPGDSLYVMSPIEVLWGYVFGHAGTLPPPTRDVTDARRVLEDVVRDALLRQPCGVAFSGGRDSSAVLAVATHVARRDGLPDPLPITRRFPGVASADEVEWQEAVVRHLGLTDWHRIDFHDELDVVGPIAAHHLLEHGVVWPPAIAGDVPLVDAVPGGSVIDGEGGDDVLGETMHRVGPLSRLIRAPRPVRWRRVRAALGALAPAPVRGRHARERRREQPIAWLRPAAQDALLAAVDRAERDRPLSFATSVRTVPQRRAQVLGARNRRILARAKDVEFSSPLLHPDFVHALARDGGVLGPGDRTAVLRALLADLLPDEVLTRTSKAFFTRCYMARHTREFAARWTGEGVDHELVDAEELRRVWLSETPSPPTAALLQTAWLARAHTTSRVVSKT
jgi:asparagine synthase (glutamine-hydrolysing)